MKHSFLSILLLLPSLAAAGEAPSLFPLAQGNQWKYRIVTKSNGKEQSAEQTIVAGKSVEVAGKPAVLVGDMAFAAREDGIYTVAHKSGGDLRVFDPPRKLISLDPRAGEKWNYRDDRGNTAIAVLGTEKVKVPAGEFEAVKLFAITIGDNDFRQESRRWFAAGVGMVKDVTIASENAGDGKIRIKETMLELVLHEAVQKERPEKITTRPDSDAVATLFAEGEALARKGDHKSALAKYDQAIIADPKAAKAHAYRALSLLALKRFDDAEQSIARALELNPREFTYHEIAGQIRVGQGKIDAGAKDYEKAAELSPTSAGAVYMDLAAVLAARNDPKLAGPIEQALQKSAESIPPHLDALFTLGQMYISAGRADGRKYLARYVELMSKLPPDQQDQRKLTLAKQMIRAIDAIQ